MTEEGKKGKTTLTLSITSEDKRRLKLLALEADTTMAALIHKWIQEKAGDRE